jgi:acetoin utilization protein AcuB
MKNSLSGLMKRPLIVIADDVTVRDALAFARLKHVHHLPVVRRGSVVGLVCTCDLERAPLDSRADAVMSRPVISLEPTATLEEAARLMKERAVGSVVLIDGEVAQGIVTRGDLLLARPELEAALGAARCECCGITRHLHSTEQGHTFCIYCIEPGHDGLASDVI